MELRSSRTVFDNAALGVHEVAFSVGESESLELADALGVVRRFREAAERLLPGSAAGSDFMEVDFVVDSGGVVLTFKFGSCG